MKQSMGLFFAGILVAMNGYAMQPQAPGKPILKPVSKPAPSAKSIALKAAEGLQEVLNSFEVYLIDRNVENTAKKANDFPVTLNNKITALLDLASTLPTEKQVLRTAVADAAAALLLYREKNDDSSLSALRTKLDGALDALHTELDIPYATLENFDEKSDRITIKFNKELNANQLQTVFQALEKTEVSKPQLVSRQSLMLKTSNFGLEPRRIVVLINRRLLDNVPAKSTREPAQVKVSKKLPGNVLKIEFSRPLLDAEKALISYDFSRIGIQVGFSPNSQVLELNYSDELDKPDTYAQRINNLLSY